MSRPLVIAFVALVILLQAHPLARAAAPYAALASTYARLKPSLALIAYTQGDQLITGSSFCIARSSSVDWNTYDPATGKFKPTSYFLTNAHVVGQRRTVSVFLASDPGRARVGRVVRTNVDLDAAIVEVPDASVPAASIGSDRLPEGQPIAIAGYPRAHIGFALAGLGLAPSVHEGIVNAYPAGTFIEFDAQVEAGNSGGPAFDPDTGVVYGVVTLKVGQDQTNLAITVSSLLDFIQNAGVSVALATRPIALAGAQSQTTASPAAATPEPLGESTFATYIPLVDQDQVYDCGQGVTLVLSIRAFDTRGNYRVTATWRGVQQPIPPFSDLQRHDAQGNILEVGYFTKDGSLISHQAPSLAVPLRPFPGFQVHDTLTDGTPVLRSWVGNTTLDLPVPPPPKGFTLDQPGATDHYDVQIYEDDVAGGPVFRAAYANLVGVVALLYYKDRVPILACGLRETVSAAHPR